APRGSATQIWGQLPAENICRGGVDRLVYDAKRRLELEREQRQLVLLRKAAPDAGCYFASGLELPEGNVSKHLSNQSRPHQVRPVLKGFERPPRRHGPGGRVESWRQPGAGCEVLEGSDRGILEHGFGALACRTRRKESPGEAGRE